MPVQQLGICLLKHFLCNPSFSFLFILNHTRCNTLSQLSRGLDPECRLMQGALSRKPCFIIKQNKSRCGINNMETMENQNGHKEKTLGKPRCCMKTNKALLNTGLKERCRCEWMWQDQGTGAKLRIQ